MTMNVTLELIFVLVFFIPMALMVALNLLMLHSLPDVAGPWARVSAPMEQPQPAPRHAAPLPARAAASAYAEDEDALEAA
jgi:hypothetical protein